MNTILVSGMIWTLYGLAGILGIQKIPKKFQGQLWTKRYIRSQGMAWILLGIPWIILALVTDDWNLSPWIMLLLILECTIPSFLYSLALNRTYTAKLYEK